MVFHSQWCGALQWTRWCSYFGSQNFGYQIWFCTRLLSDQTTPNPCLTFFARSGDKMSFFLIHWSAIWALTKQSILFFTDYKVCLWPMISCGSMAVVPIWWAANLCYISMWRQSTSCSILLWTALLWALLTRLVEGFIFPKVFTCPISNFYFWPTHSTKAAVVPVKTQEIPITLYKDNTVMRSSCLYARNPFTDKAESLYWNGVHYRRNGQP